MADRKLEFRASESDAGLTVKYILKNQLHISSREISHAKFFDDGIRVNDEHANVLYKLNAGDILTVVLHENYDEEAVVPTEGTVDTVYEDEDIIVVNKPAGMVVHPLKVYLAGTLANILTWYFQQKGERHVIRPVGRLDKDTSGLIVFAKNRHAASVLSMQGIRQRRVKEYQALCSGHFDQTQGTIDYRIADDPNGHMVRIISDDGLDATTHYQVIEQFDDFALVRVRIETGRTHQIRVHMKAIGHPLLGDPLYAPECQNNHGMNRAALHSSHMELWHPVTDEHMSFDLDLPTDMLRVLGDHYST